VIGTGPDLNSATDNGLARAAELLAMSVPEVANRATISGAIEIGRHPGVVQVTFRAPVERIAAAGLLDYAREQYGDVPAGRVQSSAESAGGAGGNGASGTTSATAGTEGTAPSGA
jgi:hypothetical protein